MTTPSPTSSHQARECALFEERLPAWLEGELAEAERSLMERHGAECVTCAALVADIDEIVREAQSLPPLTPSRDLWQGIESRLGAPVISLDSRREDAVARIPAHHAGVNIRWFAVAATVLVAVSSGVTWTLARAHFGAPASSVVASGVVASTGVSTSPASPVAIANPASPSVSASDSIGAKATRGASNTTVASATSVSAAGSSASTASVATNTTRDGIGARQASNSSASGGAAVRSASSMREVDAIYEREIAALRRIVNQRLSELDPETVAALRQNLRTIDQAILDSRRALERDPKSGLLSTELDRTLEAKLALMRRVALL